MSEHLLPEHWIERIWSVMLAFYGSRFTSMWSPPAGVDALMHVSKLKDVWRRELAGFVGRPEALAFALDHLPDHPPTLPQFVSLCLRCPEPMQRALPAPKADPARVREALARMRQAQRIDPKAWARELRDRELQHGGLLGDGRRMTHAQKTIWRAVLGQISDIDTDHGDAQQATARHGAEPGEMHEIDMGISR